MPTNLDDPYYQQGYRAFTTGAKLADAPHEITRAWEIGWLDAFADSIRPRAVPNRPSVKGSSPR